MSFKRKTLACCRGFSFVINSSGNKASDGLRRHTILVKPPGVSRCSKCGSS
ncbi:hypothetical protein HMPREF1548_06894 [Clostridium sp. KLE 1755]|nr:hypothetical protein HMPREF1548_06894 [Clostridium sp. KLE 1755]